MIPPVAAPLRPPLVVGLSDEVLLAAVPLEVRVAVSVTRLRAGVDVVAGFVDEDDEVDELVVVVLEEVVKVGTFGSTLVTPTTDEISIIGVGTVGVVTGVAAGGVFAVGAAVVAGAAVVGFVTGGAFVAVSVCFGGLFAGPTASGSSAA